MAAPHGIRPVPVVQAGRCSGCGRCVATCPGRLFTLEVSGWRKLAVLIDPARCNRCGQCREECPVEAL